MAHQTHTAAPAGPVPRYPIDAAVSAMPSSDGLPCTESYLFGEMACAAPNDEPQPFRWSALWAWLCGPRF